jgi:streptogramin lyase
VTGGRLEQLAPGTVPAVKIGGSFALPVTDGQSIWSATSGDETAMNLASGIAQVDPVTGEVVDSWDSGPVGYDIAVGPDRGIWFLGADGLERLNPTTGVVDSWPVASDLTPTFIVPARNGVWIGTYEGTLLFRAFKDGPVL